MKTVHRFTDGYYPVTLEQRANGEFRVTYGLQVEDELTYAEAAYEYGVCVFHSLACAGKLNNEVG